MGNLDVGNLLEAIGNIVCSKEFITWCGSVLGAACLFMFKNVRNVAGNLVRSVGKLAKHRPHTIDAGTMELYELVNRELIALLTTNNAARVTIWQFHNGETFTLANPAFKMRITHEQCAYGVAPDKSGDSDVMVSRMMELVGPLLNTSSVVAGVTDVTPTKDTDNYAEDSILRTLRIDRDKLHYCTTKYFMNMNNIDHAFLILLTSITNKPIGILTIQHMIDDDTIGAKKRTAMLMHSYASIRNIQFALDNSTK